MLAYVFDAGRLGEKLVDLVTHIELLERLKVSSRELLLNPSEYLQCSSILGLPGFVGNTLLSIKNAALQNGWPAVA